MIRFALAVLLLATPASADRLYLANGQDFDVDIWREEGTEIVYQRLGGEIRVPASEVIRIERTRSGPTAGQGGAIVHGTGSAHVPTDPPSQWDDPFKAQQTIEAKCDLDWPDSGRMRNFCRRRQDEAYRDLRLRFGTPDPVRLACARDWPDDFRMRLYCERKALGQ